MSLTKLVAHLSFETQKVQLKYHFLLYIIYDQLVDDHGTAKKKSDQVVVEAFKPSIQPVLIDVA